MRYFDFIWYTYISGEDSVSHARMVAPSSCPFELSPLDKLDRGKFVRSITLKPFEIY